CFSYMIAGGRFTTPAFFPDKTNSNSHFLILMSIFSFRGRSFNAFLDGQYNVSVILSIKRKNRLGSRFFRGFSKLGNF
ncbi:hypothetical protein LLE87_28190, partial [Paenibacillus polymyxa]|nr:hypothetical protein [Paenibacillus polymyxa]